MEYLTYVRTDSYSVFAIEKVGKGANPGGQSDTELEASTSIRMAQQHHHVSIVVVVHSIVQTAQP